MAPSASPRETCLYACTLLSSSSKTSGASGAAASSGLWTAGRLIPVPRTITADCGLAWRAELSLRPQLEALTQSMDVAGYYELEL